mgnify:FL=1
MLGFHQNVESDDTLSVYLDFISYGTVLENTDSDYLYQNNISSFKYKLKHIEGRINMGIDEQNERYVIVVLFALFRTLLPILSSSPRQD